MRIGPLTPDGIDLVNDELATQWRTVSGLEWQLKIGGRLREQWLGKMPRWPDPSWTSQEVSRMQAALTIRKREAAAFARLMEVVLEVTNEPTYKGSPGQDVLDEAWRRLDAERVALPGSPREHSSL